MELFQIRYVLAVAQALNFTRAARDCNVSQPALTKAVRSLEAELGAPLFHREGKRILLSEFGRSMLPLLENIMGEAEAARTLAQNFKLLNKVPVRLGVMSTVGHMRLSRFFAQLEKMHRGVELSVRESDVSDLKAMLSDGEIDLAVLNPAAGLGDGFHLQALYTERYVVIFPPDHERAKANAIALRDLSGEPYVDRLACEMREMVLGICQQEGVELYAKFRSEREDWVQAMVLAGIGFAFMPEYSVTLPGLLQRPLVEPTVERTICLATMPGRPFSPAVSAFVRAARSFAWPG
jgi:DNA-binding transcriptional LysR family regulator